MQNEPDEQMKDKVPNGRGRRMKDKMPMEMNSQTPRRMNGIGSHRGETSQNLGEVRSEKNFQQAESRADQTIGGENAKERSAIQNRQRQRPKMDRQKSLRKKDEMDKLWQELQDDEERSKRPPSLNEKQFDKLWEDFNEKDKEEALAVEMNAKSGKKHRKSADKKRQNAEASQSSNDGKMGAKKVNGESAKKGKSGGVKKKQSHSS
ncbi:hypothetical protein niasHT_018481 [Heterodera trifolii]|uniref:Uncharacterized protein n=1 Tax=Heterodera trifolii TaxID=157864 RepID=A0ABD2KTW3_9BILA